MSRHGGWDIRNALDSRSQENTKTIIPFMPCMNIPGMKHLQNESNNSLIHKTKCTKRAATCAHAFTRVCSAWGVAKITKIIPFGPWTPVGPRRPVGPEKETKARHSSCRFHELWLLSTVEKLRNKNQIALHWLVHGCNQTHHWVFCAKGQLVRINQQPANFIATIGSFERLICQQNFNKLTQNALVSVGRNQIRAPHLNGSHMCAYVWAHPTKICRILWERFVQNIFFFKKDYTEESENAQPYKHLRLSNSHNNGEGKRHNQKMIHSAHAQL